MQLAWREGAESRWMEVEKSCNNGRSKTETRVRTRRETRSHLHESRRKLALPAGRASLSQNIRKSWILGKCRSVKSPPQVCIAATPSHTCASRRRNIPIAFSLTRKLIVEPPPRWFKSDCRRAIFGRFKAKCGHFWAEVGQVLLMSGQCWSKLGHVHLSLVDSGQTRIQCSRRQAKLNRDRLVESRPTLVACGSIWVELGRPPSGQTGRN